MNKFLPNPIRQKWLLMCIALFFSFQMFGQTDVNTRYILFDVTGSMVGKGNDAKGLKNQDVWDKAIKEIQIKLHTFDPNDNIILYFFGSKLIKIREFKLDKEKSQINAIINEINRVKSKNDFHECTCTYTALNEVFDQLNKKTTNTIWVFTDGIPTPGCGNCIGMMSKKEISEKLGNGYKEMQFEYLYIYELKPIEEILDTTYIPEEAFDQEEATKEPAKINISDIVIDFRKGWENNYNITLPNESRLDGRTLRLELSVNDEEIKLESDKLKVDNNSIPLKFSLEKNYYGNKEKEVRGKLKVVGANSKFFEEISVIFKMPVKSKVKFKIKD